MKRFTALILVCLAGRSAAAQSISDLLKTGVEAYEKSNTEAAKNAFATIIASRQQVTPEQRVTAYKYLGAYWALQSSPGARDSADNFFRAAIDNDPFTDLDRKIFAADEQNAFARAKTSIFKTAIAPIEPKAIDPSSAKSDSNTYLFRMVATRPARIQAKITKINAATPTEEIIYTSGSAEGVRDIPWTGLLNSVRADTGLYELKLSAWDARASATEVVETQRFRVEHFHALLEQELPPFRGVETGATDTLRSRYSGFKPFKDASKGVIVALVAGALPYAASIPGDDMASWRSHWGMGISLGAVAGFGAGLYANSHRDDSRAVRENNRRKAERDRFNAGVKARNDARIAKTILIIKPLTSAGISG